ncbi:hypothetical protein GCM10010302_38360 [Streptomyces polychromogenes]|uniref:Uncharacterized protein n=1 Tax=Streptomyces polychromogenes TaxID=67342 RepID=A0ABN0VG16_9ACTN
MFLGVGAVGCLAVLLAPVVLFGLFIVFRALTVAPEPDGEPVVLAREALTGTWADENGGTLTLAADGRFTADGVCGEFNVRNEVYTRTGTGEWTKSDDRYEDAAKTEVRIEFGGSWAQYEARGGAASPMLWTFLGDPDEGELCVLKKRS